MDSELTRRTHVWNTDPTMYHSENLRNRTEKRQHEHYPTGTKPTFKASGPIQNLRQNPDQSPTWETQLTLGEPADSSDKKFRNMENNPRSVAIETGQKSQNWVDVKAVLRIAFSNQKTNLHKKVKNILHTTDGRGSFLMVIQ